jgi:sulfate/thiosulfate transport system ATP-binding protein
VSIALQGVRKNFGTQNVLHEITQSFPAGSLTTLLGPSGCGKTTLLRIIAGLEHPDAGSILLNGKDLQGTPLARRQVGFVYQHYALFPHLTVAENIGFGLAVRNRGKAKIAARVSELLALVRLSGYERKMPHELSGGERQRTALARTLAAEPTLLLLDEPFAALDPHVRKSLRRWLRELHEQTHVTTIVVTHDADEAMEISDYLVVLRGGIVQQAGTPKNIYDEPANPFVMQFIGGANVLHLPSALTEIYVRPHDLHISAQERPNALFGTVERIIELGDHARFEVRTTDAQCLLIDVDISRAWGSGIRLGSNVWIEVLRAHSFDNTGVAA